MAIKRALNQYFVGFYQFLNNGAAYYKKLLWIVIGLAFVSTVYFGYRLCTYCRNKKVQKDLYGLLENYQQLQKDAAELKSVDWLAFDEALQTTYAKNSQAPIASWLLVLQARERIQREDIEGARASMNAATQTLQGSAISSFIMVSDALIHMDSADEVVRAQGVEKLIALARDAKNIYADMALYHLGRYYWIFDQIDEAKQAWQDLLERYGNVYESPSPWVPLAQELLEQLG